MIVGEPDVFVEVEHLDTRPLDAGLVRQRVEECKLRHSGGGDDPGVAEGGNRFPEARGGIARRRAGERSLIREHTNTHVILYKLALPRKNGPMAHCAPGARCAYL
jgi:hypothetical protein